jgi:hypothetical protein
LNTTNRNINDYNSIELFRVIVKLFRVIMKLFRVIMKLFRVPKKPSRVPMEFINVSIQTVAGNMGCDELAKPSHAAS